MTGRERWTYRAHRLMERLAMSLDERLGRRLFALAAAVAYRLAPRARRVVEENLAQVLRRPPDSALVATATREAFRSYARYWHETFYARVIPDEDLRKRTNLVGVENVDRALEAGRGAVVALPHLGNWDIAARWMTGSGYSVTAVAEELRPRELSELFIDHRRALGLGIVPLSDARRVGEELVRLLGRNEVLALVADRDLRGRGVPVEMFGAVRRLPAGPALLSLATGAPLIPAACYDTEDGWTVVLDAPLEIDRAGDMRRDVAELTRRLAAHFERSIAGAPTQWHMFQPAWPPEDAGAEAS